MTGSEALPAVVESSPPVPRRTAIVLGTVLVAAACFLLFANLGHYYFWADEADTVLFAQGILQTGDTSAVLGDNVYAYRNGLLLENLRNRFTPPLPYYLAALAIGTLGDDPLMLNARLPFAICGLATVLLVVWWLWRARADLAMWWLVGLGMLGNVSFFLYARQCRYYAVAIAASMAIAYLYVNFSGQTRRLVWLVVASLVLMATQYLNYFALYGVLAVDYMLWQRRRQALSVGQWLVLLVPQAIAGAALLAVWNPLGKETLPELASQSSNVFYDKLLLLWWNFRDLNTCEYGVGLLMVAALLLRGFVADAWLVRAPVAIAVYVLLVTLASPQVVALTRVADIRYLAPLIGLCVFLTARSLRALAIKAPILLVPLALVAFGSNLLNAPLSPGGWRSTPLEFIGEITSERTTATMLTADWLDRDVKAGATIWVVPHVWFLPNLDEGAGQEEYKVFPPVHHKTYSLMVHAPRVVYAWQILAPPAPQFESLPEIHYFNRVLVDGMVAYGERAHWLLKAFVADYAKQGVIYERVKTINVFWEDGTRPELFQHLFKSIEFDEQREAVYIYALKDVKGG